MYGSRLGGPGGPAGGGMLGGTGATGAAGGGASGGKYQVVEMPNAPTDSVSSIRWSPASCPRLFLGAGSWDGSVRLWEVMVNGQQAQGEARFFTQHTAPVLDLDMAPDGRVFFGGCDNNAYMWDLNAGSNPIQIGAHDMPVSCIGYISNTVQGMPSEMVVTGSWDGKIRMWDLRNPRPVVEQNLQKPIHHMDIKAAPMGTFVTGREAFIFNLAGLQPFTSLTPHKLMHYQMRRCCCSKDQSKVAVVSSEGRGVYYNLNNRANDFCFKAHMSSTTSGAFICYPVNFVGLHPGGTLSVTGGSDGVLKFWDTAQKTKIDEIPAQMTPGPGGGNEVVPISAGDMHETGNVVAFSRSYDWAMGKENFNPKAPHSVCVFVVPQSMQR